MKRRLLLALILILSLCITACAPKEVTVKKTYEGNLKTYYEMSDGSWQYNSQTYKYRLEISNTMPNTDKEVCYVYLSNIEEISFDRAMMASGLGSNTNAYFKTNEAVLVEMNVS